MRYCIIGNSAAGLFAAEAIRRHDDNGQIDIISDETYPAYARCLTSYYLIGQMTDEQIFLRDGDHYSSNNFQLNLGQKAVEVDPQRQEVRTDAGRVFSYDKLLIATGASPMMPDLPGIRNRGVFGLRTLADAKGITAFTGQGKQAVVVGGGFVSLKAAYALMKTGMKVTCIISSGQILSQMLDRAAADILAALLVEHGLQIKYMTDVAEILGDEINGEAVTNGVRLTTGEVIAADVVIVGKGVTPNTAFLMGTGVRTDRGIVVDDFLMTSVTDIYAAGDVVQATDLLSGEKRINAIWPNATEQGRVAGLNMVGIRTPYEGSIGMNSADFFGLSTIAAGVTRGDGEQFEVITVNVPSKNQYLRLVFREDTLAGYIIVGDTSRAGILTALVRERTPLGKMKDELVQGRIRQRVLL